MRRTNRLDLTSLIFLVEVFVVDLELLEQRLYCKIICGSWRLNGVVIKLFIEVWKSAFFKFLILYGC